MAAKIFEVGDVLPATTQLRISWADMEGDYLYFPSPTWNGDLKSNNNSFVFFTYDDGDYLLCGIPYFNGDDFYSPYTNKYGDHPYMDIDTSNWSLEKRTISSYENENTGANYTYNLTWEDLNASSGYSVTFEENGGTSVIDLSEQIALPNPLPTPTKSGYTFVAWYYESNFQTRAKAGDTIESNVTLYAKWHNLGSLFTEIADAIRSKDGTSENIRDVDFGERVKQIQGAKEEETKTVTPNFSSGNVDVTPTSGKVMTQVTINKDSNLIASNIKKGVIIFGITGSYEPAPSGPKIFEVGDVLPATTQLRISWDISEDRFPFSVTTDNGLFMLVGEPLGGKHAIVDGTFVFKWDGGSWVSPYNNTDHAYIDINTSTWNESKRTVHSYDTGSWTDVYLFWEDLNA